MFVTGPRPFGARVPSRTMQLCSSSVTSLPPLRWYLRSARIASSRPVILRSTTSRCVTPWPSVQPTGSVTSKVRRAGGPVDALVDTFQPLVLQDDGLLEQRGGPGLEVGELRGLDPGAREQEGEHLLAVVALLDHSALADLRAALLGGVEVEDLLEPVTEALVLRAPVDVPLDRQRLELDLRGGDLVDVVRAAVGLVDRVDLAIDQTRDLADAGARHAVDDQHELVGPERFPEVSEL